jgi:hypothetical protein
VSESSTVPLRSASKQRLYDWIKTILIILAVGPPIGGFVFGLLLSIVTVLNGPDKWEFVPASMIISMFASYVFGLPIGIVAVALFLVLTRFISRGTAYLAVLCGVISTVLLIVLNEMMRPPVPAALQITWTDFVLQVVAFGFPSALSAWLCWRITKPLHRLS